MNYTSKQIITYDNFNFPRRILFSNGSSIDYVYAADGTRLRAVYTTVTNGVTVGRDSTDYRGELILRNSQMEKFLFSGGYATINSGTPTFHYYTQDHLGNNRAVVNESGTVEQVTHYYPFGGVFDDASTGQSLQPYKYNGKELDRMHGLDTYDYGARQYYAPAMRWDRVDPLAEKYYHISPYVYCADNPVSAIDFEGKIKVELFDNNQYNQLLIQNAINYPDNGNAIHLFSHGKNIGLESYFTISSTPIEITNPQDLNNYKLRRTFFLSSEEKLAERLISLINQSVNNQDLKLDLNSDINIVLHACDTGIDLTDDYGKVIEESFAATLSRQLPNSCIIAPSGKVTVTGHVGGETKEFVEGGDWILFKNGEVIKRFDGDLYPFSDENWNDFTR